MEKQSYYIDVRIRIRPVLGRELNNGVYTQCLAIKDNSVYISKLNKAVILGENITSNELDIFTFNQVYDQNTSQEELFNTIGIRSIQSALDGYNTTIFSYGQTGSGKTYTIEGNTDSPGLIPNLLNFLFKQKDNFGDITSIKVTALQIYLETLTDLLSDKKLPLAIKKTDEGYDCKYLSEWEVGSFEEAMKLFNNAQRKRVTQCTKMNDTSSRGHVIYTLKLYKGKDCLYSKFNLVDLAGSERISKSGTTGVGLKESISINKSLYSLQGVVDALTNPKSVLSKNPPFKDSKLTMILKDSLGGNCITYLIANISPSLTECSESLSTLNFAKACGMIKNEPKKNKAEIVSSIPKKNVTVPKKVEKVVPWKQHPHEYFYYSVNTEFGEIAYIQTTCDHPVSTFILLHANPSDSTEFIHWFQALAYYKIRVIAIDQPGFGRSNGKSFPCNSKNNLEKGGPCDVVMAVINALGLKGKIAVGGYDWGAGIAISLCTKYKIFNRLVAFLPSYAEPTGNELKCIIVPTLVLWMDLDQFHLWSKWKALADKIPKKTVEVIKMKQYKVEHAGDCYHHYSDKIMRAVVMHFGIPDPLGDNEELLNPTILDKKDTKGNMITAKVNLNFLEDLTIGEINLVKDQLPSYIIYVNKFKELYSEIGRKLFDNYKDNKEIQNLFTGLPTISPQLLEDNPTFLVQIGIWKDIPKNIDIIWKSEKYFIGRKVLIFIPSSGVTNTKNFLVYDPESTDKFLSPYGVIKQIHRLSYIIQTIGVDGRNYELEFPKSDIHLYNSGQIFYKDNLDRIELEDGIKANYNNPLVKAKLLEISINLAPIVEKMDFGLPDDVVKYQKEAVITLRQSLDLISFYKGVVRTRHGRTDCIGKLGIFGQAQCHGLSSTMSGYLLPFINILGFELLYRGGFSFVNEIGYITVSNTIEKHQWLQINFIPSMKSYAIDVWYQEQFDDEKYLMVDLETSIMKVAYPHPKLLLKNKV
jgi:predicted esterase